MHTLHVFGRFQITVYPIQAVKFIHCFAYIVEVPPFARLFLLHCNLYFFPSSWLAKFMSVTQVIEMIYKDVIASWWLILA